MNRKRKVRPRARVAAALLTVLAGALPWAQPLVPGAPSVEAEATIAGRISDDRLRRTVRELVALGPRLGGSPSGDRAVDFSRAAFERLGLQVEAVRDTPSPPPASLEILKGDGTPRTVVATLGDRSGRYYLVAAHGDADSGGPGADDNASGVAVVLEVARVLAAARAGGVPVPRIRFVVWGTEYWSSRAYVEREAGALAECAGVINIDQAGTGAERETVYFEGNDVPWNAALLRTFERVGREYLGRPGYWPEAVTTPTQGGTDAYAFLPTRFKGDGLTKLEIPATTVFTSAWGKTNRLPQTPGWDGNDGASVVVDYSRHYHRATDTPENTTEQEPQNMVRVARAITIALLRLGAMRG